MGDFDINDLLRQEGDESVRRLFDEAHKKQVEAASEIPRLNGQLDLGDLPAASDIKPRNYQVRDIQRIDAANSAVYVMPTGGGKTVVFCMLIAKLVARGERILVITHRKEILDQVTYQLQWMRIEHGIIKAGRVLDLDCSVQVASIQTLSRRVSDGKLEYPKADAVFIDECQHARAMTWLKALNANPLARRYGFTATPCRGDGKGLGDLFDELIIGPQVRELQDAGHLVKVRYFAPANPDLRGVRTQQGDYVINELAERMNRAHLVGDIVTHWFKLAELRRTIVFAVDRGHAAHICDEFVNIGVRAEYLDGNTSKREREEILARLKSGETEVVVNCMVLTEGFDCPPVGCIVLARPTKQLGLYRQMAGRGLRPADKKSNLILIDHSGAVYRHGLLEDEIVWTLDVDGEAENTTHKGRAPGDVDRLVKCSQCDAVREPGQACPNCGFKPGPRPDAIICKDEDLVEVGKRPAPHSIENKMRWYRELMGEWLDRNALRTQRGQDLLKPGWPSAKFKEKFGAWPPFDWKHLYPASNASPEIKSWCRSQDIRFRKRMQKERGR